MEDTGLHEAFFTLHRDLPREGPGSDEMTRRALRRLPDLPPRPRVVDFGCGPGRQTLVLARELDTTVVAVDTHQPFLDQLRESARRKGLDERVITCAADMTRPDTLALPPGSVDLIWSEGAVYIAGFEQGLRTWRPLLTDNGLVVVSELSWFVAQPPPQARSFWQEAYPAMTDVAGNIQRAEAAGYQMIDHFRLPSQVWWDEYFNPLIRRMEELAAQAAQNEAIAAVIQEQKSEIELFDRFHESCGYEFYLMRKAP